MTTMPVQKLAKTAKYVRGEPVDKQVSKRERKGDQWV